jgi:tRNA A-37 threonylcarbamoyl transferase component Bud32
MRQSQEEHEEMTQTWLSQVRSEILTVVTKMAVDLHVTPRSLVSRHQSSEKGPASILFYYEDENKTASRKVANNPPAFEEHTT